MEKAEIRRIKESGAETAVHQKIDSALWHARRNLEEATYDCLRHFKDKIDTALDLIQDACDLNDALPTPSPPDTEEK